MDISTPQNTYSCVLCLKEVDNVMDMVFHPFKILAYISLNWNLTSKYLRVYATRHKFVRLMRINPVAGILHPEEKGLKREATTIFNFDCWWLIRQLLFP